jgi:hypothetical protein
VVAQPLTVRDLLQEGEPLWPSEVLEGEGALGNPVAWVVSLRPYTPAFPRMRGEELALVSTENLARLDLPPSLADVIRQLARLHASAVAVRGEVDADAREAAREVRLPLLLLPPDAPLPDIEQAVMRECAMRQALAEVQPQTGSDWLLSLLGGRHEPPPTRLPKYIYIMANCVIAYISSTQRVRILDLAASKGLITTDQGGSTAILLPDTGYDDLIAQLVSVSLGLGISTVHPLAEASLALEEAKLAAKGSRYMRGGAPTRYVDLGADRLLLLLHRDAPEQLHSFVTATLGSLLEHDHRSSVKLAPTIEAFVRHGGRLRETAASLYVHRNTLAYRLERASELLGIDLRAPESRLAVELAFRALPLLHGTR